MDNAWVYAIPIAVLGAALVAAIIISARRRKAMAAFAQEQGFRFSARAPGYHKQYKHLRPFNRGHSRHTSNLIMGRRGDFERNIFDYRYTTGSGKNRSTHRQCVVIANVPMQFDRLEIRPEHFFDKVAATIGFDDIDFESDEFSRKFYVKSTNRKRAYAIIHPRMMEYLLCLPKTDWQLDGPVVMIILRAWTSPDQFPEIMDRITGFIERIPHFVKEDLGWQSDTGAPTSQSLNAGGTVRHVT